VDYKSTRPLTDATDLVYVQTLALGQIAQRLNAVEFVSVDDLEKSL
jgi:hypothetical protein